MISTSSNPLYFEHNQARIAYDFTPAVQEAQKLLVLVNGFARTRLDFRAFIKRLQVQSPHVATLSLDNRYCGQTEVMSSSEIGLDPAVKPRDDTKDNSLITQMADDVLALASVYLKKLHLNSFSLLGISMGGMIAQTLAAQAQDGLIETLFLVSTTAGGKGRTWSGQRTSAEGLEYKNLNTDLESTKKNMSRYFGERFLKNSPLVFETLCKNMLKSSQSKGNDDNARVQFNAGAHFDGTAQLSEIKAQKTIIFTGTDDKIIPPENADFLNKQIAHSQLIVYPEVGHLILMEEPQQFISDVAMFL